MPRHPSKSCHGRPPRRATPNGRRRPRFSTRKALKLKPDWAEGLWEAGSIEYDQDQYKECSADFRRLATLKPDQPPAWIMAGLCEYHLRDYAAALKSLQRNPGDGI